MMRGDYRFVTPMDVRWADMDILGHVNNAKYFTYVEHARLVYLEEIGVYRMVDEHQGPVVAHIDMNFRRPLVFPTNIDVGIRIHKLGRSSFRMNHAVFERDKDVVYADGEAVIVWSEYKAGKSLALPDAIREKISTFEGMEA